MNEAQLAIFQMRLDGIAQTMQDTLFRCAVSPVVREGNDAASALVAPNGEIMALSDAIPLLLGALQGSVGAILDTFPADEMRPGDLFRHERPLFGRNASAGPDRRDAGLHRRREVAGARGNDHAPSGHWRHAGRLGSTRRRGNIPGGIAAAPDAAGNQWRDRRGDAAAFCRQFAGAGDRARGSRCPDSSRQPRRLGPGKIGSQHGPG